MPDKHGKPSDFEKDFYKERYQQELRKKQEEVTKFRRLVSVYNDRWQNSVTKYPELRGVKTISDFQTAREKNPTIPLHLFEDFEAAQHHEEDAKAAEAREIETDEKEKDEKHHDKPHGSAGHQEAGPEFMDQDPEYHRLIEADPTIQQFREKAKLEGKEDLLKLPSVVEIEEGVYGINPELVPHLQAIDPNFDGFSLEERARDSFRNHENPLYRETAKEYDKREKKRVYKNPNHDPEVKRLERKIKQQTNKEMQHQTEAAWNNRNPQTLGFNKTTVSKKVRGAAFLGFAKQFAEKAAAYAKHIPEIQESLLAMQTPPAGNEPAPGEWHIPEGIYGLSTTPNDFYSETLSRNEEDSPLPPSSSTDTGTQAPDLSQYHKTVPVASAPAAPATGGGTASAPVQRTPTRAPARSAGRGGSSSFGRLANGVNKAIDYIPQVQVAKKSIRVGVIVAIIFIAIIIYLFANGLDDDEGKNPDGSYQVTVEKTGPSEVPNRKESDLTKPDESDIEYNITVTFNGQADKIVITDPLDDNADFVSASGPGNPTYDAESHTVTWNILPEGSKADKNEATTSAMFIPKIFQTVHAQSPSVAQGNGYQQEVFSAEGLPPPEEPNPVQLDSDALKLWKEHFLTHAVKAANAVGIDVGWVGFWAFYEGINFDLTFSNCNEDGDRFNPNKVCTSDSWQVGPAVRPFDLPKSALRDAFDVMYGDHSPETIKRVGQQVIDRMYERHDTRLTYPADTFPTLTIEELESMGTPETRQWFVHLTRDDAIGMYYIAKTFQGHIDSSDQMSTRMCGWGACGAGEHYDPQRTSNYIKAVYDAGLEGTNSISNPFGTIAPLGLIVRPKTENSWVINQAFAEVIGARAALPGSSIGTGKPGQPLPEGGEEEIKRVLCDEYNVCPTKTTDANFIASSDWTLEQLTALWNVVQRMYESGTYKTLAMGKNKLEISRVSCYLDPATSGPSCGDTWGFYSGLTSPQLNEESGALFIGITDAAADLVESPVRWEWLFAHEIGHSASGGTMEGERASVLGGNEAYDQVFACGEIVSSYGQTLYDVPQDYVKKGNENNSEILAFYMTAAEEADAGYYGPAKNLKIDFPCTYNAVKEYYFDGVEF